MYKYFSDTQHLSYVHKPERRMQIWIFTINTHLMGKRCFYFVLFFTVHSWFCWFKQCGEMLQCPQVVAKWAVKLRGRALWLAGSSLPYINNNSYNKIKTVTKCSHKSEQTLQINEGYTSHVPVTFFLRVSVQSVSHIKSTHSHIQCTMHTTQQAYKHTQDLYTNPHRGEPT